MAQFPISARTIAAGPTVFGPVTAPASWNTVDCVLDFASLVGHLDVLVEWSSDGITWKTLLQIGGAEPGLGLDKYGHDRSQLHFAVSRPSGFASGSRVRLTLTATNAFASSGGTLTVT
jgi:hypothetical protein